MFKYAYSRLKLFHRNCISLYLWYIKSFIHSKIISSVVPERRGPQSGHGAIHVRCTFRIQEQRCQILSVQPLLLQYCRQSASHMLVVFINQHCMSSAAFIVVRQNCSHLATLCNRIDVRLQILPCPAGGPASEDVSSLSNRLSAGLNFLSKFPFLRLSYLRSFFCTMICVFIVH